MPSFQGEFDGLCGMYAVANAFEVCGHEDTEDFFRVACACIPKNRWPEVLWEGVTFPDMKKMVRACIREYTLNPAIELGFPFEENPPKSNAEFWQRFDDIFSDDNVICGIIGQTKPDIHWIVITRDSVRRLTFHDSTVDRPFVTKNRASLYAGERRQNPNQWLIDRRELITFTIA